ncbi:MAG: hypothetical protein Q7R85_00105 [bacterium]|nr:hypothetical protein [bacterium]
MMQRITGAVAICVQLNRDVVTDNGPQHHATKGILRRTFTVERHRGDAHRCVLYLDVVGVNPTTLSEKLAWDATREAWQLLLRVFHDLNENLSADWSFNEVRFDIPFALENVYGFLKDAESIVNLVAPDVTAVA